MFKNKYTISENYVVCYECYLEWLKQEKIKEDNILKENERIRRNFLIKYLNKNYSEYQIALLHYIGSDYFSYHIHSILDGEELVFSDIEQELHQVSIQDFILIFGNQSDKNYPYRDLYSFFIKDLDKMCKILNNNGVQTDIFDLLEYFNDISYDIVDKKLNEKANPICNKIRELYGDNVSLRCIISEYMKIRGTVKIIPDEVFQRIIENFDIHTNMDEFRQLVSEIVEDKELEYFEKNLTSKKSGTMPKYDNLSGYEFEHYIKILLEKLGCIVESTPLTGDQGADLVVKKDDVKTVVQIKKYSGKVPNSAIQQVVAAINYYNADSALVITNSFFTDSAIVLAQRNNVELWDKNTLDKAINFINSRYNV